MLYLNVSDFLQKSLTDNEVQWSKKEKVTKIYFGNAWNNFNKGLKKTLLKIYVVAVTMKGRALFNYGICQSKNKSHFKKSIS